ncbi:Uma2 family endonuclease [Leptolyngbya sp. NIES-2104]|uniref:Uma2 family endonuclease n=1 Tax=Leptolyngbya sp. NIES-2104 TaxID=1552121 RepID=UPI0006ECB2EA|nr:Uma2 family endonuclease [Leptolyngbya sp. NIES-2104]GAP96479.1 predicted dioxygenase [Leptolyngbya sp. NIES-2104]
MTITRYKWTLDRYHQAIEAGVFDDQNVELLRGEIVVMPPEGEPHVYFSDRFSKRLQKRLGDLAQIREGRPIVLPNHSEPQPDIAVVQSLDAVYLEHHPYPENIFWLIEYSNTTLKKDLEVKAKIYAEAGIREYWVVDLKNLQLTVFRDPTATGYETEFNLSEGTIAPLAFPDLQIEVRQLFSL